MCKALSLLQFVMTVKKDSCPYEASMSVDKYINKQINEKEVCIQLNLIVVSHVPGHRVPVFPAPATQTQSFEKQDCPGTHLFSPTGGRDVHWDRQAGKALK